MTAHWNMRMFRDSLVNFMSGLGVPGRDKAASGSATFIYTPLTQMEVEAAYRSNWLARKLIDIPAQDATRAWRSWQCDANETEALEDIEASLNLQNTLKNALIMARLYGGAALVLGVDQGMPNEPLDLEKVGKGDLKFVVACSRYTLGNGPIMRDVMSPDYGKPEYFTRAGAQIMENPVEDNRIHPSRVIMLRGMSLPDPITTGEVWGDSVLQVVLDAVMAATSVAQSIATLVSEAKVDVIHVPDLAQNLSSQEYANQLTARFAYANTAKSVVNTLLLDKEEEWERIKADFTTLPDILQMYLIIVSGAADIPATRMLGQSPSGLNATGDADLRNYYDHVNSDQSSILSPVLATLDDILIRSALGDRDPSIYYVWSPLWQLSEEQKATVSKTKADAFQIDATTGIIDQEALRIGRQNQLIEDGTYPGLEQALEEQEQLDLESMVSVEEQQAQEEAQQQAELQAAKIGGMASGTGNPILGGKKKKPAKSGQKDSPWRAEDERTQDFNKFHRGFGPGGGEFATGPGQGGHSGHEPAARARAHRLRRRGELSRGKGRVEAPRHADLTTALHGLPRKVSIPGYGEVEAGPFAIARSVALDYTRDAGIDYHPPTEYVKVDPERATRVAKAYDDMDHDPQDPTVKAAYAAMISETIAQWHAIEKTGLDVDWIDFARTGDPYAASPRLATEDVRNNNHLWVFPTSDGFGSDATVDVSDNPLLGDTGIVIKGHKLVANDVFRIVHDYFGHVKEGNGFRADGEENAWRSHSAMYSPLARWAMTSETRGQNSWVNYGPYGEINRHAKGGDTHYADQKVGLLPEWVIHEGSGQPDDLTFDDDEPDETRDFNPFHERGGKETGGRFTTHEEAGLAPAEAKAAKGAKAKPDKTGAAGQRAEGIKAAEAEPETKHASSAFVSPNVGNLSFEQASAMLKSPRQKELVKANAAIDRFLGIKSEATPVIGAWADGAENSMMLHVTEATTKQARAAAAMKGYIADQKAVVFFEPDPKGKQTLMSFSLPFGPDDAHKRMIEAGVEFHTLEPVSEDETVVHVMAMDQATIDATEKVARYDAHREKLQGNGELIGEPEPGSKAAKSKKPKSGRQQRDEARERYEAVIQSSLEGEDSEAWGELRDTWVSRFDALPLQGVEEGSHPAKISAGVTTTNKAGLDSEETYIKTGVETMQGGGPEGAKKFAQNMGLHAIASMYLGMRAHEVEGDPNTIARNVIDRVKDNLHYLWNKATASEMASVEWYRAANKIIKDKAKQYGLDEASVAGVFAALSPMKDWDQNVHLAIRMLDIYMTKQNFTWTDEMSKTSDIIWADRVDPKTGRIKPFEQRAEQIHIQSKTGGEGETTPEGEAAPTRHLKLSELSDPTEIGMWIRTYDETYGDPDQPIAKVAQLGAVDAPWLQGKQHERGYRKFDPSQEGSFGEYARGKKPTTKKAREAGEQGKLSTVTWQAVDSLTSAMKAMESQGNRHIISEAMGGVHKVRNFYNNLIDPDGLDGDVTIDSHALAAAWLRYQALPAKLHGLAIGPDAGKAPPDFEGSVPNNAAGSQGTYGVYADAYRELADELGILPNELQAVIWVVKRDAFVGMYDDHSAAVDDEWRKFQRGEQELDATQDAVWKIVEADRAEHAKYEKLGVTRGAYKKQQETIAKREAAAAEKAKQHAVGKSAAGKSKKTAAKKAKP